MSLSTLLEAAKYLDYLDSNKNGAQQSQTHAQGASHHSHTSNASTQQTTPSAAKKSSRRHRSSRKDAANTMLAMSLPTSTTAIQMHHGVPIPLASTSDNHHDYHNHPHHAASLSSSFTTESPLSSFASTALLCSKLSGVTSASSSAASSLSSSDSSSSCGEILMGDNDFGQSPPSSTQDVGNTSNQLSQSFTHQQSSNRQTNFGLAHEGNQSFAHYIAATSAGPQLVTMTATSASAPIDGRIRAGHVIATPTSSANATATGFDPRQFSLTTTSGRQTFGLATSLGSDNHLASSPGSCPPLIMARVQPMILNSIPPSSHQSIMAFQQQHHQQQHTMTASSPTSTSSSYSRHRELHKTLEKNRRAHLRHCFEILKAELPASDCVDKKTSHINIIKSAIRYVLALRQQECEIDNELQRLTKIKNELTDKLTKGACRQQQNQSQQPKSIHQVCRALDGNSETQPPNTSPTTSIPIKVEALKSDESPEQRSSQQQPAAEQQLSFLLSQSKID